MFDIIGKRFWYFLISGIVILSGIIALIVFGLKPGIEFTSGSLLTVGFKQPVTMEQVEQAVTQGAKVGAIFAHVSAVVGVPIVMLIVAGLGLLIINAIFGKELNFATAYSITCYASLPSIMGSLMGLVMIFLGDVERFNPQNPAPTNVGFFLNPLETAKPLYALASSIDVFTIWFLILLGIGFSTATGRKVKSSTILACYAGLWALWVLIKVGFALIM